MVASSTSILSLISASIFIKMTAEGVRLRNSTGVDCFLNCATNILASNKLIRSAIFKDSPADEGTGIREEPGMNTLNGIGIGDIRVDSPNNT